MKNLITLKELYNSTKELSVLYVEDDTLAREINAEIFMPLFTKLETAADGVDGLEKYQLYQKEKSKFYDLVITDINMPRKDGLSMIKDIMNINSEQIIIVNSAYTESAQLIDMIELGVAHFLNKPIVLDQFKQLLSQITQQISNEKMKVEFLIAQSKLASMGEMLDTIAHQWLRPITIIKMQTEVLEMKAESNSLDKSDISACIHDQALQIDHIIQTLGEFRTFFRPSDKLSITHYSSLIESVLVLLKDQLALHMVTVDVNIENKSQIQVIPNEFKHVIINIINNSIDEFISKNITHPNIIIHSYERDEKVLLEIEDNAGGIPDNIIGKIFESDFTTKTENKGTGVGLHLVSLILEKIGAAIEVQNVKNGAKFTITLDKFIN